MIRKTGILILTLGLLLAFLWSCSSVKHVPDGSFLLDKVSVRVDSGGDAINTGELYNFLRQTPNHKVLGFAKLQLGTYNLSGSDTTKWYNRWLRNIGQPPVIYDENLTAASVRQLRMALVNRGYLDAAVNADTISRGKKIEVNYRITPGRARVIGSLGYEIADSALAQIVFNDTSKVIFRTGSMFDRNVLDEERARIAKNLRGKGYYGFSKENIVFIADTVAGDNRVDLTMRVSLPRYVADYAAATRDTAAGSPRPESDFIGTPDDPRSVTGRYRLGRIFFYVDSDPAVRPAVPYDTVDYKGITVVYGRDRYLKPSILDEKCLMKPGKPFDERDEERTYEALAQLGILKFINIELRPVGAIGGETILDVDIILSRNKKQGITVELEGTNSEGDLGFGAGLTYRHRNLAKGSEMLTAKIRGSYESLSGKLDGFINNRFTEYASEVGITFPKFECPFVRKSFKQRILANTEFAVSFNYQERPEYTRIIAGAAWKYKWSKRRDWFMTNHNYDFVDINYVKLPRSTLNLLDEISPNPLLRYSYEDHLIMRMGYTYSRTNRRIPTATVNAFAIQPYVSSLRFSVETAGNLLYAISRLTGAKRKEGAYKVFGTQYSQYAKADFDYTYTKNFNSRNALAIHVGTGIAVPYANSSMVPFEKRFYAGGANGVRGWGVRTLGPGAYDSRNSLTDFINQCGDIRLDLSLEYRAKLFWVFEGALFVDAGNIWTVRDYPNQPGGMFKFDKFYKQIALAYGIGLRMDFTYFLLRLDLGMKAHNPAANQEEWPLVHPRWKRDSNFHFSVGYPF